jgi:hypothetical protein
MTHLDTYKQKSWPKEGLGVKLPIWLPTTKSPKSSRFPCVQVACNIPFKSSWWGLQFVFRPHLNQRFAHKVMGPQSCGSLICGNFETPNLGVPRQNDIWVLVPLPDIKYTIRGKVVASHKFRQWWVLWIRICLWLILTPKVFQLCTNHLVFGFV